MFVKSWWFSDKWNSFLERFLNEEKKVQKNFAASKIFRNDQNYTLRLEITHSLLHAIKMSYASKTRSEIHQYFQYDVRRTLKKNYMHCGHMPICYFCNNASFSKNAILLHSIQNFLFITFNGFGNKDTN